MKIDKMIPRFTKDEIEIIAQTVHSKIRIWGR